MIVNEEETTLLESPEGLIFREIEENKDRYVRIFQRLVRIDSTNPPGNEMRIALEIENFLKGFGVECDIHQFGDNRSNLVATLNRNFKGINVLYNGHMDTVPIANEDDWNHHPLSGDIVDGILYGKGAVDMKSGLTAMVIALSIIKKLKLPVSGNLILNAVAEEESGGLLGTKWCVDNLLRDIKCDFAVVGEPTDFHPLPRAIVVGEKGSFQVKITVNGVGCHASVPFNGINPILILGDILQHLDEIHDFMPKIDPPIPIDVLRELVSTDVVDPYIENLISSVRSLTGAVTMFSGGVKENTIPSSCEAIVDFRTLPNHNVENILKALEKLIKYLGYSKSDDSTGTSVSLEIYKSTDPSYFYEWKDSEYLKKMREAITKSYGSPPCYFLSPASADAEFLRNTGWCKKTVSFGPGRFLNAHAKNECIEISDFINAIKTYTIFAHDLIK